MKSFLKNWKTTAAGFVAGIAALGVEGAFNKDGTINVWAVLLAGGLAAAGMFAKDRNVTGGTVAQTKVAATATGEPQAGLPGPTPVTPSVKPLEE